ncbi:TetR family transcriptional regulator [Spiractinospora alimapuensis]|uniref:TetR/AcrR family transcriptional regulator n=1 Tax=Spiractinospora alimapuensis TaxID=2820884 RepID=UPI001F372F74|nr:TetR/AcrR family transcriptional regulator [Spiractinospora alimapuensis]QVQ52265.1 TetR family transcriptional regulator [Spiractinospora alimapuensis]
MGPAESTRSLRETKKLRTRANIIEAVLTLASGEGLEVTTVSAIAAEADIGLRTFFRFFPSKEDAVVAPEAELFQGVLDSLGDVQPNEVLGTAISRAFDTAVGRLDASWWDQFKRAARLVESSHSANAAAVLLCARTRERLHEVLRDSLQEDQDHVIELALEGVLSGWHLARRDWIADGGEDPAVLLALVQRNMRTLEEQPLAGIGFGELVMAAESDPRAYDAGSSIGCPVPRGLPSPVFDARSSSAWAEGDPGSVS